MSGATIEAIINKHIKEIKRDVGSKNKKIMHEIDAVRFSDTQ